MGVSGHRPMNILRNTSIKLAKGSRRPGVGTGPYSLLQVTGGKCVEIAMRMNLVGVR